MCSDFKSFSVEENGSLHIIDLELCLLPLTPSPLQLRSSWPLTIWCLMSALLPIHFIRCYSVDSVQIRFPCLLILNDSSWLITQLLAFRVIIWLLLYFPSFCSLIWNYRWHSGKETACQCWRRKRCGFDSWLRKIPWSRKW